MGCRPPSPGACPWFSARLLAGILAIAALLSAPLAPVRAGAPGVCPQAAEGPPALGSELPRTGAALRTGEALTILVMGGGTDRQAEGGGFAARLETALEHALPGQEVRIQAIGASGQLAKEAADRLRRTVAETPPVLVVWRTGVGDALAMTDPAKLTLTLRKAADWLSAHAVDLVLVDPAWHTGSAQEDIYRRYAEAVAEAGRHRPIAVFPRYTIMRAWTGGMAAAPGAEKEACLARLLAAAILRAAGEPATSLTITSRPR